MLEVTNLILKIKEDKAKFRKMEEDYFAQKEWVRKNNLDLDIIGQ
jgi:hypothetical protein